VVLIALVFLRYLLILNCSENELALNQNIIYWLTQIMNYQSRTNDQHTLIYKMLGVNLYLIGVHKIYQENKLQLFPNQNKK